MFQKGDKVLVTKPEWNFVDVLLTVEEPVITDEYLLGYFGDNHIIVKDKKGHPLVVHKNDCRLVSDNMRGDDLDKVTNFQNADIITLKKYDNGTRKLFYQIIDVHENSVSFFDDHGYRRTLSKNDVEKVEIKDWFKYINELDQRLWKLTRLVEDTLDLIRNDIDNKLHDFRNN